MKSINPSEYINELDTFLLDISIVSLIACLWVMFVFINSKKWNQMPHLVTMGLAFAQVCGCIGKDFLNGNVLISRVHGGICFAHFWAIFSLCTAIQYTEVRNMCKIFSLVPSKKTVTREIAFPNVFF